ncbi:MAG: hydantoinase/oxoprolinase family protein [Thermoanaerobaculia bacterium]
MQHGPDHWQVWVDTGGTFTDCLARDPHGGLHRAKVLSSGRLRSPARPGATPDEVLLDLGTGLPEGFFAGCRLRPLADGGGAAPRGVEIAEHLASTRRLRLAGPLDPALSGPATVEVDFEEEAPLVTARLVTRTPRRGTLPPLAMRLATTRGTNALLERRGAAVALFVNRGFADLLSIGTQQRPELFTLDPARPDPLHAAVVEVGGRLAADGSEIEPLDLAGLRPGIAELLERGIRVAAVALLHGYRNRDHEQRLAAFLRQEGFEHISCSAALAPRIQILPRAETAMVDAYLTPTVSRYLDAVRAATAGGRLHVMTSAGGLVEAGAFHAQDSLLSGPAGGVVGAAAAARDAGYPCILAFDMGGTSTDVCRVAGEHAYRFDTRIAGVRVLAPALAIETVAAGGGSVCRFDGSQLKVGPESAGADPGPACYGAGGPLTLTDVNLLLGRLEPRRFGIPLRAEAAEHAFAALAKQIERQRGERAEREPVLEGLLQIANERMAEAIRRISIRRGYDPADHALLAFGGAGGQHACALAGILGMRTVLIPPDAGLLSALGLGAAAFERFAEREVLAPLSTVGGELARWIEELAEAAREQLLAEGNAPESITRRLVLANLRLRGQETSVAVEVGAAEPDDLAAAFHRRYRELYGYGAEGREIELESLRVAVSTEPGLKRPASEPAEQWEPSSSHGPVHPGRREPRPAQPSGGGADGVEPVLRRPARFAGAWLETDLFERRSLTPGSHLDGPALVLEDHCTTVVEPGWRLTIDDAGTLVLERREDVDAN